MISLQAVLQSTNAEVISIIKKNILKNECLQRGLNLNSNFSSKKLIHILLEDNKKILLEDNEKRKESNTVSVVGNKATENQSEKATDYMRMEDDIERENQLKSESKIILVDDNENEEKCLQQKLLTVKSEKNFTNEVEQIRYGVILARNMRPFGGQFNEDVHAFVSQIEHVVVQKQLHDHITIGVAMGLLEKNASYWCDQFGFTDGNWSSWKRSLIEYFQNKNASVLHKDTESCNLSEEASEWQKQMSLRVQLEGESFEDYVLFKGALIDKTKKDFAVLEADKVKIIIDGIWDQMARNLFKLNNFKSRLELLQKARELDRIQRQNELQFTLQKQNEGQFTLQQPNEGQSTLQWQNEGQSTLQQQVESPFPSCETLPERRSSMPAIRSPMPEGRSPMHEGRSPMHEGRSPNPESTPLPFKRQMHQRINTSRQYSHPYTKNVNSQARQFYPSKLPPHQGKQTRNDINRRGQNSKRGRSNWSV